MTSLIDVIFLLLLFFMLTSTFSKFSEVELSAAGSGTGSTADTKPIFLQLEIDEVRLNGESVSLENLATSQLGQAEDGAVLLVALGADVTAQRLTDLLVSLRGLPALRVTVMGS